MAFNSSMPMFWGDYLRDTMHLSPAEHGAYMLLIAHQWTTAKPIPDDDAILARIARMAPREWRAARRVVEEFFVIEDGTWNQKRVEKELRKAQARYEQSVIAGQASAERRRQRTGNGRSTTVEPALQQNGQRNGNQPKPEPKPEPIDASSLGHAGGDLSPRETFLAACWTATDCDPNKQPLTEVVFGQWFSEGAVIADLSVIPAMLERERVREGNPSLTKPPGYYTQAVRRARMERQSGQANSSDLRSQIDAAWEKIGAA